MEVKTPPQNNTTNEEKLEHKSIIENDVEDNSTPFPENNEFTNTKLTVEEATQRKDSISNTAWERLKTKIMNYNIPISVDNLYAAYKFANNFHADQKRKSGEPYIIHPLAVAEILAELEMDETSLLVAILHDVVEDTQVSLEEIEKEFGSSVTTLVDGLTKLEKVKFRSSEEKQAENFRKMVLAMSKDIRVIIIKIADRLHNMRTIRALALDRRQKIAEETLEIYAPLAGRLGIYKYKAELEDLCLKELKPSVYFSLATRVAQKKDERENVIQNARAHLLERLAESGINAIVVGRAKHFYSIYKKMVEREVDFEDIYDLFAIRIIVDNIGDCYESLGIIHSLYRPVPGRFKDFVAMPKANLYQSLHTTVIAAKGELLEIQIRTHEMHSVCEHGIAAHWAYKETNKNAKSKKLAENLEQFNWLHQMVSNHKEISDANEFLEAVKVDLFDEEIYVFSPRGDVFNLRRGATCLDFAFAVHSDLGLRVTGCKVNGRITPIRTILQSGDVMEVLSGARITATQEWLSIVITSRARNKIRSYLRNEQKEEAKRSNLPPQPLTTPVVPVQELSPVSELLKNKGKSATKPVKSAEESVRVQGLDGIVVRLAKCCEPLPGQEIFGFVSRGRGVTVHTKNCPWSLTNDPSRQVECSWNTGGTYDLSAKLRIATHDKPGILAAITKLVASIGLNIMGAEVQTTSEKRGLVILRLRVASMAELKDIHQKLEALDGVISVERVQG